MAVSVFMASHSAKQCFKKPGCPGFSVLNLWIFTPKSQKLKENGLYPIL